MPYGHNVHRYRRPEFLHLGTEQELLAVGILIVTVLLLAIILAGISLIENTNSLLLQQ